MSETDFECSKEYICVIDTATDIHMNKEEGLEMLQLSLLLDILGR